MKYKAYIILSDKKNNFTFRPSKEQLEDFLNDTSDIVLRNQIDDEHYKIRVTDTETGIIYNTGITVDSFKQLYHKLVYEM